MKRTPDKRIAIVGASTSGLYAALLLARRGFDVTVYERSSELDPAPRTLIVTDKMRELVGPVGERSIVNHIDRFELFANGKVATVELGSPDLIIERSILIRDLAKEAEASGVALRLGHSFRALTPTPSGVQLRMDTDDGLLDVEADTVIAADGSQSAVARAAGWAPNPTLPLVQGIVDLPEDCAPETSRVWFRPQDSPYFYWLIAESGDHAALGLIGEDSKPTKKILDSFLQEKGFTVHDYQAARIPCYVGWVDPYRRLGGSEVYLVGDAAGHVKVSTVGGIVTGFRGAAGVANAISSGSRLKELAAIRLELNLHLYVRRALHSFSTEDYCALLDLLNSGVRDSLARFNRDETPGLFMRLARTQPRLVALLLKGLVRRDLLDSDAA